MKRLVPELHQGCPAEERRPAPELALKDTCFRRGPASDDRLRVPGFEKGLIHKIGDLLWHKGNAPALCAKLPTKQKCSWKEVVFFDLETTGLHPERGDRVIEIGAIKVSAGNEIEVFQSLIHTDRRISRAARSIHGIQSDMLKGMPSAEAVFRTFFAFIGQGLLVAHNARFDIGFLRREFRRCGLGLSNPCECTLRLSRRVYPWLASYSLAAVYRHLCGYSLQGIFPHRALHDAYLTAAIWLAITATNSTTILKKGQ